MQSPLRFEWDDAKDRANRKKHGIAFAEAQTAFFDENALRFLDPDDSAGEDRFILLGMSSKLRVLVICHCFRDRASVIRIVSAGKADKREAKSYWRE